MTPAPPLPKPSLPGVLLGAAPSLWEDDVTRHAPALRFLEPHPRAELSPEDARELGIGPGDEMVVSANGTSVRASAALRCSRPAEDRSS